jgi:hypothetical protein
VRVIGPSISDLIVACQFDPLRDEGVAYARP